MNTNTGRNDTQLLTAEAEAAKAVKLWDSGEKASASGDALATHAIVMAYEVGFFDGVPLNEWCGFNKETKGKITKRILGDLFKITKPASKDRQRLQRLQELVPAIIKCGGLPIVRLGKTNNLLVDASTSLYKNSMPNLEASGHVSVSIAKLRAGARIVLGTTAKRGTPSNKQSVLDKVAVSTMAKTIADRTVGMNMERYTQAELRVLRHCMYSLISLFAYDDTKKAIDFDKVAEFCNLEDKKAS